MLKRWIAASLAVALSLSTAASSARAATYSNWANAYIYNGVRDPSQVEMNQWGMDHAIISAGIHAVIAMVSAAGSVLQGRLSPIGSYTPSSSITAQSEQHFVDQLTSGDPSASSRTAALDYVKARYADYVADAQTQAEPASNVVTACAYFAAASIGIELDRELSPQQRRALRGACVVALAGRQAGLQQLVSERERQSTAEVLLLVGGMSLDQYHNETSPDQRAKLKAGVEAHFKEYFDTPLQGFPIDHIFCAGAATPGDYNDCKPITNDLLASVADHTK